MEIKFIYHIYRERVSLICNPNSIHIHMAPQRKRDHSGTNESTKSHKQTSKKQKAKEVDKEEDHGIEAMFENSEIKSDIWRGMFLVLSTWPNVLRSFSDIVTNTIYKKNDVFVLSTFLMVLTSNILQCSGQRRWWNWRWNHMVGTVFGSCQGSRQCDTSMLLFAVGVLIIGWQINVAKIEWFLSNKDIPAMAVGNEWKSYHQSDSL